MPKQRSRVAVRTKVTDEIIATLLHDIASGVLKPGDRMDNERDLAAQFGVSQPTIREAIRVLDTLGLIDVRHGSGAYATGDASQLVELALRTLLQIERVGILDVLEIHVILGEYSARCAVHQARESDIAHMNALAAALADSEGLHSVQEIAEMVVDFQATFAASTRNPLLFALEAFMIKLLMQFQLTATADRGLEFWRERSAELAADRRAIVAALRERDEDAMVAAISGYLASQGEIFASDPELANLRLSDAKSLHTVKTVPLQMRAYRNTDFLAVTPTVDV